MNGRPIEDSVEEDLMVKLERILKINLAVADFVFELEMFKTAVARLTNNGAGVPIVSFPIKSCRQGARLICNVSLARARRQPMTTTGQE
jgi:hypothetical protein